MERVVGCKPARIGTRPFRQRAHAHAHTDDARCHCEQHPGKVDARRVGHVGHTTVHPALILMRVKSRGGGEVGRYTGQTLRWKICHTSHNRLPLAVLGSRTLPSKLHAERAGRRRSRAGRAAAGGAPEALDTPASDTHRQHDRCMDGSHLL